MADLQKTIQIIFGATDNVSDLVGNIDTTIGGLANSVEDVTQPFLDLSKNILKVEAAITTLGVAALFYANSAAVDLASAETSLQKVLGDSEGSVDQYSDKIKDLSLYFGVAGDVTTETAAAFKQAGFNIDEALGLVGTALTAVKIAELSAEQAGALLISNIRGIGAEAEDAAHFMDAWNEISNTYAVTAGQVAEATAALAPIAKTAGLSFDELVGLTTPMIEVLQSGSEAGTTLKVSLASLITPAKRVTEALDALGISQHDANGELRLSGDILDDLGVKWPELTESQQANYGILLFGKEQYARMNIVLNDYDKVLDVTTASQAANGSATEELAVKMKTAVVATERLNAAFTFAASTVGKQYLENTTNITNSLTKLAISFDGVVADGGLAPLFDFLNPLLEEFSNNISLIAENLPEAFEGIDYTGLIKSLQDIGFEFGELFEDVDLTTVEGLHEALQSVVDGLASLNQIFAGVIEGFAPVIKVFQEVAKSASETDSETAKFIGNILGYGSTINVFAGWLGGLTGIFGALSDAVIILIGAKSLGLLPESFGTASKAASGLTKVLGSAGLLGAAGAVGAAWGNMIYEFSKDNDIFIDITNAIGNLVDGSLADAEKKFAEVEASANSLANTNENLADSTVSINDAHILAYEEATKYDQSVQDLSDSNEQAIRVNAEMELSQARLALQMIELGLNLDGTKFSIDEIGKVTKVTSGEFEGWYRVVEDGIEVFYKTKTAAEGVTDSVKELTKSEKELAEETKKAEEAAQKLILEYEKLEIELEKIASNERIKSMEFIVELETAKVEADAKKVVAAFESISESYAATSTLIGDLYSSMSELSRFDQLALEASIDKAEKLAREQWETQKALIEAQIEQIEASTDRLTSGESLITVDGGELQPELEAIMQSLFKSIRIKMSADYENFLLGLA